MRNYRDDNLSPMQTLSQTPKIMRSGLRSPRIFTHNENTHSISIELLFGLFITAWFPETPKFVPVRQKTMMTEDNELQAKVFVKNVKAFENTSELIIHKGQLFEPSSIR